MKSYTRLPKYCKRMTREELLVFFPEGTTLKETKNGIIEVPHYTTAFMMRTLIMNEKEHCDKWEIRTLRGVWYSAIKPTLDKLGLLSEDDQSEDSLKRWDATLSNYVCDLLRKGELTFSDLGIRDISRQKSTPSESFYNVEGKAYAYQGGVAPYPNILIATEKDTVYSIISSIAEFYGCSSISCKGQNSLGAMELIVKGMFRNTPSTQPFATVQILTMTDYDPAGYYIAEALEKQVRDILDAIGRSYIDVETHRIGITPDQLSESDVYENMYSPKKANIEKWMDRTGGIDGMEKGLELDAFSSSKIREIFVDKLSEFVDVDLYSTYVKRSYIKMKILEAMKDKTLEIVESVTEKVLPLIEMKEHDIHEFAKQGQSSLRIDELCEDDQDESIEEFTMEFFNL